ncbi:MAG: hypothetical protein IJJ71_00615 [Treponema sp.]|uniref:pectinesterase family protein n=1 Tax=Treponema sp. TaxID=166 RepID=UPI0025EB4C32|nr:pectinesterase family protein [Treponema sp.]MBR0494662.1 hypothetical protein [Treponema sp.]
MKKLIHKVLCAVAACIAVSALSAQNRKVDVWDFGGVQEAGANNHISIADIDALTNLPAGGKYLEAGDLPAFGDLTVNVVANDRAYYDGKKNYGTQGYAAVTFDDGYSSNGIYYCNGTGGNNRRCLTIKNVKAGDIITFYARLSAAADTDIHFSTVDADGKVTAEQDEVAPIKAESKRYSYVALTSGTYRIWTDKKAGKPVYYRVVRTPAVEVSGKLENLNGNGTLKFVIAGLNKELDAKVSGNSYRVNLPPQHTFTAVLSGIAGYGISPETRIVDLSDAKAGSAKNINLVVGEAILYKASGRITGIDANYDTSKLSVVMNPPAGGVYQSVEMAVSGSNGSFSYEGKLEPMVPYTAQIVGANDYEITAGKSIQLSNDVAQDIVVGLKPTYETNGKFFGETSPLPTKISFKNMEDGYVYDGVVSKDSYSVKLRDGSYEVSCETDKAKTINHIVVAGKAVSKDIKMSLKDKTLAPLKLKKDLKVGPKAEFKTVSAAVKAASAMGPKSEKDRITIHIAPGTYREQILIDVPYITLKNDTPSQEVKLTWYYGIGYNYYSADEKGWYDEDLAYDKFVKHPVAKWGGATYIKPYATAFRAEGITFETSFNKYMTDDELSDGVASDGSVPERKINSDVRSKALTERSAAILIEAVRAEFFNCKFLGSQDTLYTGYNSEAQKAENSPYKNEPLRAYFRNCFVEGNTDFIFGDGDVVFENCEISFAGYTTEGVAGGYLTAARTTSKKGYLFYDCVLSANQNYFVNQGYLGRPWGKEARVAFIKSLVGTSGIINPLGWTQMSGNKPEDANFKEFGTIEDGAAADFDYRVGGTTLTGEDGYAPKDFFGDWTPAYFAAQTVKPKSIFARFFQWLKGLFSKSSDTSFAKKPSFTTDDDINTPYPGHTITLHYSLGQYDNEDVSEISWYSVTEDGTEFLMKQSKGFADKTYLIKKDDQDSFIKAVVTPKRRFNNAGEPKEIKLEAKIKEGYAAPSKAAADRPRTAGAVNVFLAGDSTVKDYSSNGIWMGGKTRSEGAWGEYLQNFFNNSVAVQNYAEGGRSTRNFINEGSLQKIADKIGKGDYLFIQFGHNDCHNEAGYLEDRYVPLGKADSKGIYPVTAGKKVPTPSSYVSKYGAEFYGWKGGTYKWYLKQYIDVAKNAGAIPVLVTPVSRLYYNEDGTIRPHHDSTAKETESEGAVLTENNAYCEAVRQLAKEEKVILIDGFEITKKFYEDAYKASGNDSLARKLMFPGDSTHNNKLGGFVLAGEMAKAIKSQIPALGKNIVKPAKVLGENADGQNLFTVDSLSNFTCDDEYWTKYEQKVIDSIK